MKADDIRLLLTTVYLTPTAPQYTEEAALMNRLLPFVMDSYTDAQLEEMWSELWSESFIIQGE